MSERRANGQSFGSPVAPSGAGLSAAAPSQQGGVTRPSGDSDTNKPERNAALQIKQ